MGIRDEIKTRLALAYSHQHDVASGAKPDHETRQLLMWLAADVQYLLSELGKHAAPVVDMTKGGVLHLPVLPINEQDDSDLAAILAEHDLKKNRTPL